MKKISFIIFMISAFTTLSFSQQLTQTVRGTIIDVDSKSPLIGATVAIRGTDPIIGTSTDFNGEFRLENIPIGRVTLQLSYLGYENKSIPNIIVNSGKEVVLNIGLIESAVKMDEIVVKANTRKGAALNDMTIVSARSISAEKTERYAGGFSDPSRILSSFAGVATTNDGDNDIIVRGNSPKYVQWRLEGMEITNPTHFADQNAVKGGISALNNNLLATSDFYTGAFSPEYGDVLSGVYDVKLRSGNNEKLEAAFGLGLLGTDLTVEGPFKKGYGGSYLFNYRYSTISLIETLGLVDIGGIPKFQDATFKIVLPTKKAGTFSLFGLAGLSEFNIDDIKANVISTPGDAPSADNIIEDYEKSNQLLNLGINHTFSINKNSYFKTSLSYSTSGIDENVYESQLIKNYNSSGEFVNDSIANKTLDYKSRLQQSTYRLSLTYSHKLNAKNKIRVGSKYALFGYDYNQSWFQENIGTRFTATDFKENASMINNFISWKHRLNGKITFVSGLHNTNVLLNNKSTLEPRIAMKWKLNNTSSFNVGYGNHSKVESIHNYFAKVKLDNGEILEPNKDLGLLKAHHAVIGYEKRFTKNLMAKVELYYQDLYNLPVENLDTSYYATINEGVDFRYVDLVNKGTGKNMGLELTLERFFDHNYYFLINASIFSSKYKSLEGIERNTQYNGNYLVNILLGKEFDKLGKKQNQTLSLNAKIFFGGGKKILPLLRDSEGNLAVDPSNNRYYDYEKAYENKIEDVYHIIVSASYKFNRPKTTHEIFLSLDNLTNTKGKLSEYYDPNEPDSVGNLSQFGFFPNLMYRVYF